MEFNKENANFSIMTMVKCNKQASEIHHLDTAWSDDIIWDVSYKKCKMVDMILARRAGSGWPRTSITSKNINTIREVIVTDPHLSKSTLSRMTDIPETAVQWIIVKAF